MRLAVISLVLVALSCGGAGAVQAPSGDTRAQPGGKTYPIKMSRTSRVGERKQAVIDISNEKTSVTTLEGREGKTEKEQKTVHFDALATTIAVNAQNEVMRLHYEVADLQVNGKSIFHGQVELTRAPNDDDAVIFANGVAPEGEVLDALQEVLDLRVGGPSDDEIFGTKEPQPVGGRWPINGALAREDLARAHGLNIKSVTGDATLASVTDCCLDLRGRLQVTGIDLANRKELPEGATVDGHADVTFAGIFPLDPSHGRLEDHMSFRMSVRIAMPTPQGNASVVVDASRREDRRFDASPTFAM